MKLFVRLQKDVAPDRKQGLPDVWPAEVEEADDSAADPGDGRLVMTAAEYDAYLAANRAAYDTWKAVEDLSLEKERRFELIDARTRLLIDAGFVFEGKTFSLSQQAQTTYTGLYAVRAEPVLVYPVQVNTRDDEATHELADADAVRAFYLTAVGTYRGRLDAGTVLKDQIRAATTRAELDAVVDER